MGKLEDSSSFQTIPSLVSQKDRKAPALTVTGSASNKVGLSLIPDYKGWITYGGNEVSQASISTRVCCRGHWEHV